MSATRAVSAALALLLAVSFATPSGARADSAAGFEYTVTDSLATVTGCTGGTCPTTLVIPARLGGYRVRSIGNSAFYDNRLTRVTIPDSVTSIGWNAFWNNRLTSVIFLGNAPTDGGDVFAGNADLLQVVRQPGATGWLGTWSGVTVVIAE
jgi:hypothetical protein